MELIESVPNLLAAGALDKALELVEKEYHSRITTVESNYVADLLAISAYLLRNNQAKAAYELLNRHPVECVELAVNLVAAAKQVKVPENELYLLQLKVLHTCLRNVSIAEQTLRELFTYCVSTKKWEIAANCGAILFSRVAPHYHFCMAYAESCIESRRLLDAINVYKWVIDSGPAGDYISTAYSRLSGCYKDLGLMDKCLESQRKCVEISKSTGMHSNLIMMMQYAYGYGMEEYYAEGEKLRDLCGVKVVEIQHPVEVYNKNPEEGLRIGFVSGDFCDHSLTNLLLPIFKQFKELGSRHSFHLYSTKEHETVSTAEYRAAAHSFVVCQKLSQWELASLIKDDGIDVLIDLAGNTAHNRLPMFYHTPAPVQMGWVSGMMTPPAVDTIPYFITDKGFVPPVPVRERLLLVPSCYTYEPLANSPSVKAELPYEAKGHITFGSFNNPCKINKSVLGAWRKILQQVPNSRLICKVHNKVSSHLIEQFMADGNIVSSRVECITAQFPRTEDLMSFYTSNIDIALDTWPCAGMLTSVEAMWMGCPVPTLSGNTFLHNQTVSVLHQLELLELVGDTEEAYVQIVVSLAKDPVRLKALRNDLRERIKASPMSDSKAIAENIVQAISSAWELERRRQTELLA